jgi:hypothetical protein
MENKEFPNKNVRPEIQELMRVCEKVIGFTHQNGGLTSEECEVVVFYVQELEQEIMPYCKHHQHSIAK